MSISSRRPTPVRALLTATIAAAAALVTTPLRAQDTATAPSAERAALADSVATAMLAGTPPLGTLMRRKLGVGTEIPDVMGLSPEDKAQLAARQERMVAAMADFYDRHFPVDSLRAMTRDFYRDTFTARELRSLLAFYRSDVGRKSIAAASDMGSRMEARMSQIMMRHGAELQAIMAKVTEP